MIFLSVANILVIAAVIPAVWLLIKVYNADKLDKEPPGLLVSLVVMGVLSTLPASIAEQIGVTALGAVFGGGILHDLLLYFIVVGLSEEGFKYLLLRVRTWKSPHFNYQFDGVVYAVFVALGFALWENIGYVFSYGLATAAVRAVTAVPGHACFGVFMGVWYGAAKRCELAGDRSRARQYRLFAVVVPTLLHGCYDFIATMTSPLSTLVFIVFAAAMFAVSFRVIRRASRNDRHIAG